MSTTRQAPLYQRVPDSGVLTAVKAGELPALLEATNPADLTHKITAIQTPADQPHDNQNGCRHGMGLRGKSEERRQLYGASRHESSRMGRGSQELTPNRPSSIFGD